ncbi:alanine acetyltransferase [Ureibacillus massiliensis 4400831 = CIP 108448 = CCUG 49529]|uniref:Alanine acetyltransferase n=1 Tax=Ureibacillus massiliensis 4400831 = CIP 108448 = CCUG 49529 TaxID=1211035 RepID=A0A0A3J1L8_9BACL|nr:GNAT family N-acetyltransferase [Ureibacillus massiliensis]KGR90904.1 alanine acetyltransferase [Ureibacillus massiliensis 4400831 = CIP 108448 = CCUG 49529]
MTIKVLSANKDDYLEINTIVKEGQDEHAEALPQIFKKVEPVMPISYFYELIENPNCEILVAKNDESIVGFAVMELKHSPPFESMVPRKFVYMNDFGVKGLHQRQGIGRVLFQACVNWSKEMGAASLELNVWEFNRKATSFYESFGMNTISRQMVLNLEQE